MQSPNFDLFVQKILAADTRFHSEAYFFVYDALEFASRRASRQKNPTCNLTSQELLDALRQYALETYGPMAITVLAEWGVESCQDFGDIIFNIAAHDLERKWDADSREDFKSGFDFEVAFRKPFLPASRRMVTPPKSVEV
jgi:uncharacterized repeat protein (TIGR04138 family)